MISRVLVSPSVLACDFGRLAEEVNAVQEAGADWIHVDVMDGHFVPNLTIGPVVVAAIRKASRIPLDVHLMLDHPQRCIDAFVDAGADFVTVHIEAKGLRERKAMEGTLEAIQKKGAQPGLSIRPKTGTETLRPYKDALGLILVMSVEPGFGGQAFIPEALPKVKEIRAWFDRHIVVDGGINAETGRQMREAGADVLVAGTYVFQGASYKERIASLRS